MASSINASTSGAGGVITTADSSGVLNIQTASTTALTVDASQNVGIGTTSPRSKLDVTSGTANTAGDSAGTALTITGQAPNYNVGGWSTLVIQSNDTAAIDLGGGLAFGARTNTSSTDATQLAAITGAKENGTSGNNAGYLGFYTRTAGAGISERMRIDSSGNVRVNNTGGLDGQLAVLTSSYYAGAFSNTDANFPCVYSWNRATSGNNLFYQFFTENPASVRGSIDYNRGAGQVRYNTTSDQRLKENIVDAPSATSLINSIKIRSFDWKETGFHVDYGVIAQELNEVAPDAVSEGLDNEDGTIKQAWGVDTSVLLPALIKTVQEQQTIINDLTARVIALEAK